MSCHWVRQWTSLLKMPKRAQEHKCEGVAKKARALDDNIPAGMKLKHDVDAMGCLILAVTKDNRDLHEKLNNLRGENETLKATQKRLERELKRTSAYVTELEARMEALEKVITRGLVTQTQDVSFAMLGVVHDVVSSGDFVRDDLERIIDECGLTSDFDVMEGWSDWLDDPVTEDMFE